MCAEAFMLTILLFLRIEAVFIATLLDDFIQQNIVDDST